MSANMTTSITSNRAVSDDHKNIYSHPSEIYGVLRSLQKDQSVVSLQFEHNGKAVTGRVVSTDSGSKRFVLGEISDAGVRQTMESGAAFSLRATIRGVRIRCRGLQVDKVEEHSDGLLYHVNFPENLLYLQRRDAYRADVLSAMDVTVSCTLNDPAPNQSNKLEGKVINMSPTGFRLSLDKAGQSVQPEEIYTAVLSNAAEDQKMQFSFEVVHVDRYEAPDTAICGCRFVKMTGSTEMAINRLVTSLQRQALA